jgi:Na+/melibiose symporter-like transporter
LTPYTTIVSMVTPSHLRSQAYAWSTVFLALGAIAVAVFVGTLADAAGQRVAIGVLSPVIVLGGLVLASTYRFIKEETIDATPTIGPGTPGLLG